ncbi:MAG: MinD/ParA family protein [Pseudomonadota bacterium]
MNKIVTLAISSGKGGVGKTNACVNLATALGATGHRVMVLDADLGLANVDVLLGCRSEKTLEHVVSGEATLDEVICDGPPGVKIIPAANGVTELANLDGPQTSGLIAAFESLQTQPDFFIVDIPAGIHRSVIQFCQAVQNVVVVACNEPASITDAYGLIKVLSQQGVSRVHLLANMMRSQKEGYEVYQKLTRATDQFLNVSVNYLGMVPFDTQLRSAVRQQCAVVQAFPKTASARAFVELAEKLSGLPADESRGCIEFFLERMLGSNEIREAC